MSTPIDAAGRAAHRSRAHQGGLGGRAAAAGGHARAARCSCCVGVLLVAMIVANPNFGDPGVAHPVLSAAPRRSRSPRWASTSSSSPASSTSPWARSIATQVVMAGNLIGQDDEPDPARSSLLMLLVGA